MWIETCAGVHTHTHIYKTKHLLPIPCQIFSEMVKHLNGKICKMVKKKTNPQVWQLEADQTRMFCYSLLVGVKVSEKPSTYKIKAHQE